MALETFATLTRFHPRESPTVAGESSVGLWMEDCEWKMNRYRKFRIVSEDAGCWRRRLSLNLHLWGLLEHGVSNRPESTLAADACFGLLL